MSNTSNSLNAHTTQKTWLIRPNRDEDYGYLKNNKHQQDKAPWLSKIWLANGISSTMVIPKKLAERYEMDKPCAIVLEEKEEGILIRRLLL
jgi:hypothetical protein